MKYICLGYMDDSRWEAMPQSERDTYVSECMAYDVELRANGHMLGGEALASPGAAATLRYRGGKVVVTDGPFAETKEYLGGILVLEARDLNHAIQLMSRHPGVRLGGCFEIRPTVEIVPPTAQGDEASDHAINGGQP